MGDSPIFPRRTRGVGAALRSTWRSPQAPGSVGTPPPGPSPLSAAGSAGSGSAPIAAGGGSNNPSEDESSSARESDLAVGYGSGGAAARRIMSSRRALRRGASGGARMMGESTPLLHGQRGSGGLAGSGVGSGVGSGSGSAAVLRVGPRRSSASSAYLGASSPFSVRLSSVPPTPSFSRPFKLSTIPATFRSNWRVVVFFLVWAALVLGFFFAWLFTPSELCDTNVRGDDLTAFLVLFVVNVLMLLLLLRICFNVFILRLRIPGTLSWTVVILCQIINVDIYFTRETVPVTDSVCGGDQLKAFVMIDVALYVLKLVALMSFYCENDISIAWIRRTMLGAVAALASIPMIMLFALPDSLYERVEVTDGGDPRRYLIVDRAINLQLFAVGFAITAFLVHFFCVESWYSTNRIRRIRLLLYALGIALMVGGHLGAFLQNADQRLDTFLILIFGGSFAIGAGTEFMTRTHPVKPALLVFLFVLSIALVLAIRGD